MIVATHVSAPAAAAAQPDAAASDQTGGADFLSLLQAQFSGATAEDLMADPLVTKDKPAESKADKTDASALPADPAAWIAMLTAPVAPVDTKTAPTIESDTGDGKTTEAAPTASLAGLKAEEAILADDPAAGKATRRLGADGDADATAADFSAMLHAHPAHAAHAAERQATAVPAAAARSADWSVAPPVASDRWSDALAQRVVMMAGQQVQSAELQLNPPQLGPLEVRLTLQNQEATLSFVSPHVAVREAIQDASPQLIEMFAGSGLNLTNVNVGTQSQQGSQQANGQSRGRGDSSEGTEAVGATTAAQPAYTRVLHNWRPGGVDTFV